MYQKRASGWYFDGKMRGKWKMVKFIGKDKLKVDQRSRNRYVSTIKRNSLLHNLSSACKRILSFNCLKTITKPRMRENGMHLYRVISGKYAQRLKEAIHFMGYRKFSVIIMKSVDSFAIIYHKSRWKIHSNADSIVSFSLLLMLLLFWSHKCEDIRLSRYIIIRRHWNAEQRKDAMPK